MTALALLEDIANGRIHQACAFHDHYDFLVQDDGRHISPLRFSRAILLELCAEFGLVLKRDGEEPLPLPFPLQVLTMLELLSTG